jgi:2-oxoglutarate dehydrogenase E2 component (dihydrolipoamide succinyltransferase)
VTRDQIRLEAKVDLVLRMQTKLFGKVVGLMGVLEDLQAVAAEIKVAGEALAAHAAAQAAEVAAHMAKPPGVDESAVAAVVGDLKGVADAMKAAVPAPAPAPAEPAAPAPAPEAPVAV